jgi:hypothetical protein
MGSAVSGGEGLRRSEIRMRRDPWRRGVLDRAEGEIERGFLFFRPGVGEGVLKGMLRRGAAENVDAKRAAQSKAAFDAEIDEFPGSPGLGGV